MTDQKDRNFVPTDLVACELIQHCHDIDILKTVLAVCVLEPDRLLVDEIRLLEFEPLRQPSHAAGASKNTSNSVRTQIEKAISDGYLERSISEIGNVQIGISACVLNSNNCSVLANQDVDLRAEKTSKKRASVFELYEQHIGLITPIIADKMIEAIHRHSEERVQEAIHIAVSANRRYWRYIEVALENMLAEGQPVETDQRDHEEYLDSKKYLSGKYSPLFRKR